MYDPRDVESFAGAARGEHDWTTTGIRILCEDLLPCAESRVCVFDGWATEKQWAKDQDPYEGISKMTNMRIAPDQFPLLAPRGFPHEYLALAWIVNKNVPNSGGVLNHWSLLVLFTLGAAGRSSPRDPLVFHHFDSIKGYSRSVAEETAKRWTRVYMVPPKQEAPPVAVVEMPWNFQTDGSRSCGLCAVTSLSFVLRWTYDMVIGLDPPEIPQNGWVVNRDVWLAQRELLGRTALGRASYLRQNPVPMIPPALTTVDLIRWAQQRIGARSLVCTSLEDMRQHIEWADPNTSPLTVDTLFCWDEDQKILLSYSCKQRTLVVYSTRKLISPPTEILNWIERWHFRSSDRAKLGLEIEDDIQFPVAEQRICWPYRLIMYLANAGSFRPRIRAVHVTALLATMRKPGHYTDYVNWIIVPQLSLQTSVRALHYPKTFLRSLTERYSNCVLILLVGFANPWQYTFREEVLLAAGPHPDGHLYENFVGPIRVTPNSVVIHVASFHRPERDDHNLRAGLERLRNVPSSDETTRTVPWDSAFWLLSVVYYIMTTKE
jgi:hypothetical protein